MARRGFREKASEPGSRDFRTVLVSSSNKQIKKQVPVSDTGFIIFLALKICIVDASYVEQVMSI